MAVGPTNDQKYLSLSETDVLGKFFCHMCRVKSFNFRAYESHLKGKRHKINVNKIVSSGKMSCLINRRIHTRSTKGPALIQPKLDLIKDEPLIGLRYLVEYVADIHIQREPIYVCKICETKLDSRNLIDHMIGLRHRMQFMRRFYPKLHLDITDKYREDSNKKARLQLAREYAEIIAKTEGRWPVVQRCHFIDVADDTSSPMILSYEDKEYLETDCIALGESHEMFFSVHQSVAQPEPLVPLSSLISSWFVLPNQNTMGSHSYNNAGVDNANVSSSLKHQDLSISHQIKTTDSITAVGQLPSRANISLNSLIAYLEAHMIDSEDEARLYKTVADSLSESVRKYRISLVVNNGDVTSQPTLPEKQSDQQADQLNLSTTQTVWPNSFVPCEAKKPLSHKPRSSPLLPLPSDQVNRGSQSLMEAQQPLPANLHMAQSSFWSC